MLISLELHRINLLHLRENFLNIRMVAIIYRMQMFLMTQVSPLQPFEDCVIWEKNMIGDFGIVGRPPCLEHSYEVF